MLSPKELCGLSCLLDVLLRLAAKESAQEIQCLHMEGKKVLTAGNTSGESSAIAAGLNAAGVKVADGIDALFPIYVAVKNDTEGWFQNFKSKDGKRKVWPAESGSLDIGAVDALADVRKVPEFYHRDGWTGTTTWAAALAGAPKTKSDLNKAGAVRLSKVVLRGMLMLGFKWLDKAPPKPKLKKDEKENPEDVFGAVEPSTDFAVEGTDSATLAESDGDNPRLSVAKSHNPGGQGLHAEQSLLRAVAIHLRAGGVAAKFAVSGQKPPCAGCKPVLKKFTDAFKDIYTVAGEYDAESSGSSKKNTEALTLPGKETAVGENYGKFFDKYK